MVFGLGRWEIDLGRREMRLDGDPVPIGGRSFEIVEVLLRAGGDLVAKQDLMGRIWPGAIVEENTLHAHISAVRKALGADRELLRTASGRGYRLLGTWTARLESASPPPAAPAPPPLPAPSARPFPTNFPVSAGGLVGRAAVAAQLRDLLSAYRIVTLTGPGGIGKTTLALDVARGLFADFRGEGWLVELLALSDPGLVPSAVAAALGLQVGGASLSAESVARAIGDRKLLLVLDNCEHVVDAAAALAETLARMAARTTILATSREVLRIEGEYVYRVPPLQVPPEHPGEPGATLGYSAVQMFIARMRALDTAFTPHGQDLETIAAICRRLDGIPLALEFAAARAATLGLKQVAARLDDRFGLLTGGRRTALPRHQTLRATLDWSYDLLPEPEQRLLRRLGVFAGGFTLDAAAAVMRDGDTAASAVTDGIANLVAKSLVILDGWENAARWRLLETIRAYALEKLAASGETARLQRDHAAHFRELVASLDESQLASGNFARNPREIDNIRAALDWAFSPSGDAELGVSLTIGAVPLWVQLSLMGECRSRVEQALARVRGEDPAALRARMQLSAALGWSAMYGGAPTSVTDAAWSATLALAQELGDDGHRMRALWGLWVNRLNSGDARAAMELAEEFARLAPGSPAAGDLLLADRMQATSCHYVGDQASASVHVERVLGRYAALARQPRVAHFLFDHRVTAHYFQARILWLRGSADQAMGVVARNIEEASELGHALSLGSVLGQGACPVAFFCGDLAAAERYVAMLLDHATRHGLLVWETWAACFAALLRIHRGEVADGVRTLAGQLERAGENRKLPRYIILIGAFAACLGRAGEVARGLRTVDDALRRCEASGEQWYVAELLRIKGELILADEAAGAAALAEDLFLRATALARSQDALAWELRLATDLARLWRGQGRGAAARDHLAAVYARFSEGFETADLRAARALLGALGSAPDR
jgi:predicted ATPase/DNA-binding winged helix-turn-helix (wHTH) protein